MLRFNAGVRFRSFREAKVAKIMIRIAENKPFSHYDDIYSQGSARVYVYRYIFYVLARLPLPLSLEVFIMHDPIEQNATTSFRVDMSGLQCPSDSMNIGQTKNKK